MPNRDTPLPALPPTRHRPNRRPLMGMGHMEVTPITKESQTGRVWSCPKEAPGCTRKDPCKSCLGKRNRRKGHTKQGRARKALGIEPRFHTHKANEESWGGALRVEVKAGAQVAPVATRYLAMEAQSDGNKSEGDPRPFAAVFMPDGITDGIFACRLSRLPAVVQALLEQWGAA